VKQRDDNVIVLKVSGFHVKFLRSPVDASVCLLCSFFSSRCFFYSHDQNSRSGWCVLARLRRGLAETYASASRAGCQAHHDPISRDQRLSLPRSFSWPAQVQPRPQSSHGVVWWSGEWLSRRDEVESSWWNKLAVDGLIGRTGGKARMAKVHMAGIIYPLFRRWGYGPSLQLNHALQ
jgi:hypothetical protein